MNVNQARFGTPCTARVGVPNLVLADAAVAARAQLTEQAESVLCAAGGPSATVSAGSWRPVQAIYRPGRRLTVVHSVCFQLGEQSLEQLVVTDSRVGHELTTVVQSGDTELSVWPMHEDPYLPGIAEVQNAETRMQLLAQLGFDAVETDVRVRSYRPTRRAVLEISSDRPLVYVKAVEPRRATRLVDLAAELGSVSGVARCVGAAPDLGLVAYEPIHGHTLQYAIAAGHRLPSADALEAQLDALPPVSSPSVDFERALRDQLRVVCALMPDRETEAHRLVDELIRLPDNSACTVHGDFHAGQVLVDGGTIAGLIDVDRAGRGVRADDQAMMLAHLQIGAASGGAPDRYERYLGHLLEGFERTADPIDVRSRVARALFGFVSGGFMIQDPAWRSIADARLDAALRWAGPASDQPASSGFSAGDV